MEIPEALKTLTSEKADFISALLKDESKGVIVGDVAFLDMLLGETLAGYFCGPSRRVDFSESIISRLNFESKIQTMKALPLDGRAGELRDKIVSKIRPMQELRNVAAHAAALKNAKIDKLYADQGKRDLLADFPKSFRRAAADVQEWLEELESIAGFEATA